MPPAKPDRRSHSCLRRTPQHERGSRPACHDAPCPSPRAGELARGDTGRRRATLLAASASARNHSTAESDPLARWPARRRSDRFGKGVRRPQPLLLVAIAATMERLPHKELGDRKQKRRDDVVLPARDLSVRDTGCLSGGRFGSRRTGGEHIRATVRPGTAGEYASGKVASVRSCGARL